MSLTNTIYPITDAPKFADHKGIIELLKPHIRESSLTYEPSECYDMGRDIASPCTVHIFAVRGARGTYYARVFCDVNNTRVRKIQIASS